jgi:hypothetical protein
LSYKADTTTITTSTSSISPLYLGESNEVTMSTDPKQMWENLQKNLQRAQQAGGRYEEAGKSSYEDNELNDDG